MSIVHTTADFSCTAEEAGRLARDGYLVRESVFSRDECATIAASCEALVERLVKDRVSKRFTVGSYVFDPDALTGVMIKWEGDLDVVHGLEPFVHLDPALDTWANDPRFLGPMTVLTGDEAPVLFTEKLNLKRAFHGGANPWHQDHPYWVGGHPHAADIATAMLFLDDASLENGTLRVLPGSHTQGQWRTRSDGDAFGNLEMDPQALAEAEGVAVEVPAGSVVYFGAFLVHTSAPNTSSRDRRSLLFSYQPHGHAHILDSLRFASRNTDATNEIAESAR